MNMKKCFICHSTEKIEMHHVIPKVFVKRFPDKMKEFQSLFDFTIPLCHFHHWMMPPFMMSENARKIKGVTKRDYRKTIRILNKKFYPKFGFKFGIHTYKNGNQDYGIWLVEINKKSLWY